MTNDNDCESRQDGTQENTKGCGETADNGDKKLCSSDVCESAAPECRSSSPCIESPSGVFGDGKDDQDGKFGDLVEGTECVDDGANNSGVEVEAGLMDTCDNNDDQEDGKVGDLVEGVDCANNSGVEVVMGKRSLSGQGQDAVMDTGDDNDDQEDGKVGDLVEGMDCANNRGVEVVMGKRKRSLSGQGQDAVMDSGDDNDDQEDGKHFEPAAPSQTSPVFAMSSIPMESSSLYKGANKRTLVDLYDDADSDMASRFKVLLPNGTSVGMTLRDIPEVPLDWFISAVRKEYLKVYNEAESSTQRKRVNWKSKDIYFKDEDDCFIRNKLLLKRYAPNKTHILFLYDGSAEVPGTFENMWDLTPDTELLKELPEEYTFETALADLIDNSLQAVWSNDKNNRRLISVNIAEERISIFDTGPGMDGSEENNIVKWGKMGASLHRRHKQFAIGGKPPYLTPFFGMFGYGGPIASMQLGRHALISSKTKDSKKVYALRLRRESLLKSSGSEQSWRTDGSIRDPYEEEMQESPHGSFTKVEIFEPRMEMVDIFQLRCKLKDIYFPYVQCDELTKMGKTIMPIEFQVNHTNLAEVASGEVAVTNMHSGNGPEFVLQLHFSRNREIVGTKTPGKCLRASLEANARIKCVYIPIVQGKENIDRILETLKADGCEIAENYENFSHVSIRRLGRLLPDARWASLPFMNFSQKRGGKASMLKRCCSRVKCFIDTDAGFNPTPPKDSNLKVSYTHVDMARME